MKILVLDVGGTYIKYAYIDEGLSTLRREKIRTPKGGREELIETIASLYERMDDLEGIAISLPGIIDRKKGVCLMGGAIRYNDGFALKESLEKRCNTTVVMENDAKCAALAEATEGSLKDVDDGFVLIFGTMIGGAFIKDHKIHGGKHFSAGEVSYINTSRDGLPEFFNVWGNRSGSSGLERMYASRKGIPREDVACEMIFEAIWKGDKTALMCLDDFTREIAVQIFNIQTILDPERFALGGGISAEPLFIDYIKKNLDLLYKKCPYSIPHAEVVPCTFRSDANLIGALKCFEEETGKKL